MRNPFRAFGDWRRREEARVEARGGWPFFWFYMTTGLLWSLWMFAATAAVDLLTGDAPKYLSSQERVLIYFVGGMFFGFVMWLLHLSRRVGRPAARR